jgi:holliday junction DNA helicase RuvB
MAIHSAVDSNPDSGVPARDVTPLPLRDEPEVQEFSLRPSTLEDYVGQQELKQNLSVFIQASKTRSEPMEHVLLHGPPGLGKTTLAHVLANEMKANIRVTSGPALERQGDVASIITNLEEGDILFIDEIHRLRPIVEETLYTAMEDFAIDIILGKGPSAKSMRLNLPRFTLIGATTKMSLLSSPLRDRFGHLLRLQFYSLVEIEQIIQRSATLLDTPIVQSAASRLASSARQTPRIANRLLRRIRDFASVQGVSEISESLVENSLKQMGIDAEGLDSMDRALLEMIIDKFEGGPVGLSTLSAATHEEAQTIEDIYEPFLLKKGFLDRTPRGRIVTNRGHSYIRKTRTS